MLYRATMASSANIPSSTRRNGHVLFQTTGPRLDVSTPEKRLALAVLADAVRHVQSGDQSAADDEAWFASSAADHPFAFVTICQALGLDPEHLRRGIRHMHRRPPRLHAA
jgi:hypothetical protein